MTKDQIGGVARTLLAAGFGWAAAKGWLPAGDYGDVIAGISTAAVAAWSVWTNRPAIVPPRG